uniref:Nuclear hormone receptor family member nhr-153 n=2 Tax=Caenorhabditis elegans TaxID=6239 RepID=NH153_CAEEL|nr:RecName: Full=Nuclear hormone receptor family member nhr-153 [Caenorhabditis elegans]
MTPPQKSKPKRNRRKIYKILPQNQCPSVCQICRNPAIGYHYEVPSCNGCKTFFRRTIITGRKFKCFKVSNCLDGNDVIDTSKRVCRACRFEKCVQAGMNPMAIQAEAKTDEGEELKKLIAKKFENGEKLNDGTVFFNVHDRLNQILGKLIKIETKLEKVHDNGMPMGFLDQRDLSTALSSKVIYNNMEIPSMSYTPVKISKNTGLPKRRSRNFVHSSCLASIEYSKTFDFSSAIDISSKIILLKNTALSCANLTNAYTTFRKLKSDTLLYPDGSIYGPPRRKNGPLIEKQRSFLQNTLISFMTNNVDKTEYILLKAIVLCNPAIIDLPYADSKHIQREREVYAQCLFRYCLLQHGTLHGPARFSALLSIFNVLENQQKEQKDYYLYIKLIHSQKHKDPEVLKKKCISVIYDQIMD